MTSGDLTQILGGVPRVKEVIVDGKIFIIHCNRYAAKSEFFNIILTQEFAEKSVKKIEINGIDKEIFEHIHRMFNTSKISINFGDVVPVYVTCRYLLLKDTYLKELQTYIMENLNQINVVELFEYCNENNDSLLDGVKVFMASKIESIYKLEIFKNMSLKALIDIISDPRVKIGEENAICSIVSTWLAHNIERKEHITTIFDRITVVKLNEDFLSNFEDIEWNAENIANTLYNLIFVRKVNIKKPFQSEFFQHDEPLYASNEDGILVITHFQGTEWSILDKPRSPLPKSTKVITATRQQENLVVAVNEFDDSFKQQAKVLYYNFNYGKIIDITKPVQGEIKGLHFINHKLFLNTKDIVQQYCPEHNLWLNPIDIGLSDYHFSTTDGESLVVCGHYDWSDHDSVHFYDRRTPEWIYFSDVPDKNLGTCGTFIRDNLFMVTLYDDPKDWRILKLDVRNCKWETIIYFRSRNLATPVSIKQCKRSLVVMDHYKNIFTVNRNKRKLEFYGYYEYPLKPVYSVDYM